MKQTLKDICIAFMSKDHSQDEIDLFYCNRVLPYDKRSIEEIISE